MPYPFFPFTPTTKALHDCERDKLNYRVFIGRQYSTLLRRKTAEISLGETLTWLNRQHIIPLQATTTNLFTWIFLPLLPPWGKLLQIVRFNRDSMINPISVNFDVIPNKQSVCPLTRTDKLKNKRLILKSWPVLDDGVHNWVLSYMTQDYCHLQSTFANNFWLLYTDVVVSQWRVVGNDLGRMSGCD